jgi:hypothetical protein
MRLWLGVGVAIGVAVTSAFATPHASGIGRGGGPASADAAVSVVCSRATAARAMARYHIPLLQPNRPVGQLLCGPFLGAGSNAMVASVAIPSCGGSVDWAVFRFGGGAWRLVMNVKHGAFLDAVGSDIRETLGVLGPGDAHCFPSSVKYHLWHWNGTRLKAGPWLRARSYNPVVSPDGNIFCSFNFVTYPKLEARCASLSPVHSARLLLDGTLTICDGSSDCLNGVDRTGTHVVPYGTADEWNDFHCLFESKGVTCTVIGGKAAGKGFVISSSGVTKVG